MLGARALAFVTALAACGGSRTPPPAPPPVAEEPDEPDAAVANDEPPPAPAMTTVTTEPPERSRPPSTASYDEALSTPEPVDVGDEAPHLTDAQLTGPMRGATAGCRMLANAHVTIKTAVQYGRAIGVTVEVRVDKPKSKKRPKPSAVKAERKAIAKLTSCIDRNVRAIVWPPNKRRDSFTMQM